ncbi:MAG TPA: DUF5666 domain-containing protein, partial [Pseudonocardiaceae bacterium]
STPPGAFGTAAAVTATSLEVQNPSTGQVTVNFTSSTKFTNTVSATLANVTVGECVEVNGTSTGSGAVTATTVVLSQPGSNGCAEGAGQGAGGFGGGNGTRFSRPSGASRPSGTPPTRRSGANGDIGRAFGSVTAVNGNTFTVKGVTRAAGSSRVSGTATPTASGTPTPTTTPTTTTVTVTGSTTYTQTVSATSSALAVGECIAAVGPSDDTGAVTATSITISKAGANGCGYGMGGRQFGGAGATTNG